MSGATASVLHARVPATGRAAVSRAGLERWLAGIELARLGLPAQAIVVVRRLRTTPAALAWQAADPLAAALRGAMRPARQDFVGAGVGVVWFADDAELLACLARDTVTGSFGARWWWTLLLGRAATPALALQHWAANARAAPQALHQLAQAGLARPWLEQMGRSGRAELLAALVQSYPVCLAVQQGVASTEVEHSAFEPRAAMRRGGEALPTIDDTDTTDACSARPVTPASALLRLAEVLRLEPQRAADARLARALRTAAEPQAAWWPAAAAHAAAVSVAAAGAGRGTPHGAAPSAEGKPAHAAQAAPPTAPVPEYSAQGTDGPAAPDLLRPGTFTVLSAAADTMEPARCAVALRVAPPDPRPSPNLVSPPSEALHTAFGGLFFLFNVALALGLYGDFAQPRHAGLPLSPWLLLHAAGRACFGRSFADDAIRPWLLQRAGPPSPSAALPPWVWPLMRARLSAALDVRGGRLSTRRVIALPARVQAGAHRLDLFFSLAALPLVVRLAGLDRDPGWLPAAGADIRFHFD